MNVCVIGNSHVGALKKAWDELACDYPNVNLFFFARGSNSLEYLNVKNGFLVPGNDKVKQAFIYTSGGRESVDPKEYDVFLVYGLGLGGFFVGNDSFYSRSLLQQACIDHLKKTLSLNVFKKLRSITDKKIYVGHSPLPAAHKVDESDCNNLDYFNGIEVLNSHFYEGLNSMILPQPEKTLCSGRFTCRSYSSGSFTLDVGNKGGGELHPEVDVKHMNKMFGRLWLVDFLSELLPDQEFYGGE
ncbi:hypothetical protein MLC59_09085 [Marinobacter bryozoorum]|uniref:hypothetical protein n=1 Tax=Marinobacter bryozoorum TaxID=256324 RepID=UPI002004A47B|nr:hypothetical protein [Marinobacter bryozoorum]MCK7544319.1 hypothetical protein [Marinobacter bryozoorum]